MKSEDSGENHPHNPLFPLSDILGKRREETNMLEQKTVTCPHCGSQRYFKDGMRNTHSGKIQRYLCRDCGHRFS